MMNPILAFRTLDTHIPLPVGINENVLGTELFVFFFPHSSELKRRTGDRNGKVKGSDAADRERERNQGVRHY